MKQPYAYLRKSRVFRDKRAVSPEMQLDEVKALAERHGETAELVVLSDMNVSGRKGRSKRPGFNQLLEAIESGEVTAVYSYSLSRLSRSIPDLLELAEVCRAAGVPIHLVVDQDPDPTTSSGRLTLTILAAMAQFEADVASERARDTAEARRARGEKLGGRFFENTDAVIQAVKDAGSMAGAAKLLTAREIPTRNGKRIWQNTSVRAIIERAAPELLMPGRSPGAKLQAPFVFYRLLRCHCGRTLTGGRKYGNRYKGPYAYYLCTTGRHDPAHGPAWVPETAVLAWAQGEAALLEPPPEDVALVESADERRNALLGRRERLGRAFVDQLIGELEYEATKAELDQELAVLEAAGRVFTPGPIDWDVDVAALNRQLRALWHYVQLGPDLRPLEADWTVPEWRREPAGGAAGAA
jgi:DNA invertase Pin-like site-specific DNA recombinase